ncbi:MAG TPA: indolepyruvate oxidoreductase subunit beta family protein [Casimicrobiaceae bacterium]|nr:indolepyruvate oxidoreductase subunit beta family protein [Casimicrobiaceae bacterium]
MRGAAQPLSVLVCALGGEGGGVLAEWLVATATRCGHAAQSTSIPGVAQRTGATTYYLEIVRRATSAGERTPIFSLYAVPGALDVLVASEPLEAARQAALGFVSRDRTHVITSTERTLTTFEKMQLADGRFDDATLFRLLADNSRRLDSFAMSTMARDAQTALSAVMLGALAGSGALAFPREAYEQTIREFGKGTDTSLVGFALGFDAMRRRDPGCFVSPAPASGPTTATEFPEPVQSMFSLGVARLTEYQNRRYASLYRHRLTRIVEAERRADPMTKHGYSVSRETARHLASWMAFDDVVRVAELKGRASRMARIRAETKASAEEIVRVYDHMKPGVPEFAGLLPTPIANALLHWDRRRVARGREAFAWPIKLPAHAIVGMLALRVLGGLKPMRPYGSRYAAEQRMIERWLSVVAAGVAEDWQLGHEIALCGRLVKGYGATNERGKHDLLHVIEHLAAGGDKTPIQRASAIRNARIAALADEDGKALDTALVQSGAPPRPVKAQRIAFVRRPRKAAARDRATVDV